MIKYILMAFLLCGCAETDWKEAHNWDFRVDEEVPYRLWYDENSSIDIYIIESASGAIFEEKSPIMEIYDLNLTWDNFLLIYKDDSYWILKYGDAVHDFSLRMYGPRLEKLLPSKLIYKRGEE